MQKIPIELHSNNKINFLELRYKDITETIQKDICHFLIHRKDENEYVDLDKYYIKYGKIDTISIIEDIIKELNILNWKTKLSFGDTGLFIYSSEELPKSCW